MMLRDSRYCLYVWEGTLVEFHGLVDSSSNSPTRWSWIILGGVMSLDVLLGEVHETFEGICSTEGKIKGVYGRGVHSIWVIVYASEYIKKIDHTLGVVIWDDQQDEDRR